MNILYLSNTEATLINNLAIGDEIVLLRLLISQPPEGFGNASLSISYVAFFKDVNKDEAEIVRIPLTHPSGLYRLKETWAWFSRFKFGKNDIVYKADIESLYWNEYKWHSPVSMPAEAVRWKAQVDTTVKRIDGLTEQARYQLGFEGFEGAEILVNSEEQFIAHWNSLHAQPVLTKEGYKVFPYCQIDWIREQDGGKNLRGNLRKMQWYWKGKPLTIYIPYVEVIKGNKLKAKE